MNHYYRKIYLADKDEEVLVAKVNEVIKKINPANLFGVDFNPIIQNEKTIVSNQLGRKVHDTIYIIKYTCIITELVEE